MNTLTASIIVFVTVLLAMAFGILLGYAVCTTILRAFGHKPQRPASSSLTTAAAGSGD